MKPGRRSNRIFSATQVASVRRAFLKEVELLAGGDSPQTRLKFLLAQIDELAKETSPSLRLREILATIEALRHHSLHGGLKPSQVNWLTSQIMGHLKTLRIERRESHLSGLYRDVLWVLARLDAKNGRVLEAALKIYQGDFYAQRNRVPESDEDRLHGAAILLREGCVEPALAQIEDMVTPEATRLRARCAWLRGDLPAALRLLAGQGSGSSPSAWLSTLISRLDDGSLPALLRDTSKRGSHYESTRILMARLLQMAAGHSVSEEAPVGALRRRRQLDFSACELLAQACSALEMLDQASLPLPGRIEAVIDAMNDAVRLPEVEQELVVWAAAARKLRAARAEIAAKIAEGRYQALSFKVSAGRSTDALGVLVTRRHDHAEAG